MSQVASNRKQEYYNNIALKLNNPKASAKIYCSVLKTCYNGKKIPVIPLLLINNKLVSNFKTKGNHFNASFASHCTPLDNNSKIPGNQFYVTDNKLSSLQFEDSVIIRMLQICDSAIIKPLTIISRNCICQSTFPDMWKKSNICPIHKKGDKQVINYYRPFSLLPICGNVFERLIFNSVYEYLKEHKFLSADQSGFRANDSCVNQLLSIVHNIYSAFDACPSLESHGVLFGYVQGF